MFGRVASTPEGRNLVRVRRRAELKLEVNQPPPLFHVRNNDTRSTAAAPAIESADARAFLAAVTGS